MRVFLGQRPVFAGFGPSHWTAARQIGATEIVLPDCDRRARRLILDRAHEEPGVYGMIDANGELIYVGKSRVLRARLVSYFYAASAEKKARRIIEQTERLVWEPTAHEFVALVRELELIRRFRPRFNVQGQPGRRRRAFLCLSQGPAPHASLAAAPPPRTSACFGPISAGRQGREAVEQFNQTFKLRDCSQQTRFYFLDQRELFEVEREPLCLRHALGTCLGPCAGRSSAADYAAQVAGALRFLQGRDRSTLLEVEQQMRAAAAERQFERAARLRNVWEQLGWLDAQLDRLRRARRCYSFVYPLPSPQGRTIWYLIREGQILATVTAPRDAKSAARVIARLATVYDCQPSATAGGEDLDLVWLVARWFNQNPDELQTTLTPAAAQARCGELLAGRPKRAK